MGRGPLRGEPRNVGMNIQSGLCTVSWATWARTLDDDALAVYLDRIAYGGSVGLNAMQVRAVTAVAAERLRK
jgi:hypothetical protein